MAGFRRISARFLLFFALIGLVSALTHSWWLPVPAYALVRAQPAEKAPIAVVLAGDGFGHRIIRAAELVKKGYVPQVLVSGPRGFYGFHECDLAIPFATKLGYPAAWFIHFEHDAKSTSEEAVEVHRELQRRNIGNFLLVTSNYHTARAARIFRRQIRDIAFVVVSAPDEDFEAENWWKSREGRKTFLLEWTKTVGDFIGL